MGHLLPGRGMVPSVGTPPGVAVGCVACTRNLPRVLKGAFGCPGSPGSALGQGWSPRFLV